MTPEDWKAIGRLEGKVEELSKEIHDQEEKAEQHRRFERDFHKLVEVQIGKVEDTQTAILKDVDEIKRDLKLEKRRELRSRIMEAAPWTALITGLVSLALALIERLSS